MSDVDLRAEFARLCAAAPAGEAGGTTYAEKLGLAVERLVGRTRDSRIGIPPRPLSENGLSTADCPFMVSVMTLPHQPSAQGFR